MSSLLPLDLEDMVLPTFNIDLYDAKAGKNEDVITLAIRAKSRAAAEDLEEFIEKEGRWVLDTDVSTGEDATDHFLVFVELKRNQQAAERICYLLDLVERLTGVISWNFTHGKSLVTHKATEGNIELEVALSSKDYLAKKDAERVTAIENFFGAAPFNKIVVENNKVTLQQFYALPTPQREVSFTLESLDDTELTESAIESTQAIWLQKTLGGNYTVEQYEDKFLLSRNGHETKYLISINV
jgi:hypothetical protein